MRCGFILHQTCILSISCSSLPGDFLHKYHHPLKLCKIWDTLAIKPAHIVADNPYFQRQTTRQKGCQIDYLIQTRYNVLFACEIKFSIHPIRSSVIKEMQDKINRLTLPKRFSCWPVLIHINGVSDQVHESGYFSEIIDFTSLLI